MFLTSHGIQNGVIEHQYGGYGDHFNPNGIPTYSLPFQIHNAPKGVVSYALVLEDKDAYPVTGGFTWVHWTAANITRQEIEENESQTAKDFIQGRNSWTSIQGGEQSPALSKMRKISSSDPPNTLPGCHGCLSCQNSFLLSTGQ